MAIPAELAYFFRQPILRDAAYQLQIPSDRARLHQMALEILEAMFDGPPPEPEPDQWGDLKCEPHPTDPVAADLVEHLRGIQIWDSEDDALLAREILYLRRAAEYAETQFDNDVAVRLWQDLAKLVEADDPATAAEAIRRAGIVLGKSGRVKEATPLFKRAQSLAANAGDPRTEGTALGNLAGVYRMTGRMEEAERTYKQALAIHRDIGNRRTEGIALGNLAVVYQMTRRMEEAERTHDQALAIHREVGNRAAEGLTLGNLANFYQDTGQLEKAERSHEQALKIHRQVGNRRGAGIALSNLAILYRITGRMEKAERTFQQALAIHRDVSNRRAEGLTLGTLGNLYQDTGRVEEAESVFGQALAIHRQTSNRRFEGAHTCSYALCRLALEHADAHEIWRTGAEILKQVGDMALLETQTTEMREACAKAGVPPFDE